jgi:Ca2+-binding EF-hand superfamily protein
MWVLENTGLNNGIANETNIELFQKRIFDIFDMDGDGALGFSEFEALYDEAVVRIKLVSACEAKFKDIDSNGSGFIEKGELTVLANWLLDEYEQLVCDTNIREKIEASMISKFDINRDGKLNQYEFSLLFEDVCNTHALIAKAKDVFVDLDKDNNGYLEGSEIDDLTEAVFKYYRPHGHRVSESEKAQMKHKIMQRCDGNHNGFLFAKDVAAMLSDIVEERSIKEAGRAKFMELDTDGSGYLDLAEVEQVAGTVF